MISKSKETQLIRACKRCDLKTVQNLIHNVKSPSTKHKYLKPNHEDQSKHLITQHIHHLDVNCKEPRFHMTPLMIASLRGSRDIVLLLLNAGASTSIKDIKGNTALQLACMKQRFHVIDALLQNKANPNDVNISGWNCLISAVNYFHEDSAIMLLLLLQTGVKSEHKDNSGMTAIDHAVKKNKINAIRVILNYNIRLAQHCVRALINASIKGYFDIVLLMLNYGVNPNKVDIITGSGPLHEAVRYNEIKDDKSYQERLKIVKFLAIYGADPELVNVKRETPMQLANLKPYHLADQYVEVMKEFYKLPHKRPKFITMTSMSQNELTHSSKYPLLRPQANWTRNDPKFCSSYSPNINKELVTNLIDGDPHTVWRAPGHNINWVIFDFKADHIVNRIRIYSWKSKQMPAELFLQVSNSLEGPWNCVQSFDLSMVGSSNQSNAGVPIDIEGFNACSRYWRLVITRNHGAPETSFHGIEFFGYDNRISKLVEQLKLTEYEQALIENELNQIEAIVNCTFDKFNNLPIENKIDKELLWNFILEFQKKVQPLKKLDWFNEPAAIGLVNKPLPAFSVTSTAFLTNTLQLVSHGGGLLQGETFIDMEPGGMNDPSMAIFRNISFANPGKFIVEVRSVKNKEVNISSQSIQIFSIGDPEYDRLLKLHPLSDNLHPLKKKLPRQDYSSDIDSDDDTLDQIYGFADFSEHTSKMKINKWLSKSQDDEDDLATRYMNSNENSQNNSRMNSGNKLKRNEYVPDLELHRQNSLRDESPDFHQKSQQEYEVQSFTLEFNDDLVSLASFNYKNQRKESKSIPKTEARVYVNNPDIFVTPNAKQLNSKITPQNSNSYNRETNANNSNIYATSNITSVMKPPNESVHSYTNEYNQYETPTPIYTPLNKVEYKLSSFRSPTSIKKSIAPKLVTPKLTPQPSISPPDYNYDSISQINEAIPNPQTVEKKASTGVPPPPPPPPPFLLSNQPQTDGLLKFTKTKPTTPTIQAAAPQAPKATINKTENPMNDLQRELESKLIKVKQNLEQSSALSSLGNNNENYATIRRFDPGLIIGPKEVSFNEDMALNALNTVLDDKENDFTFDPKETFTSKAKNALEKYKISKSSSSSEKSPNSSVDFKIKNKINNKKHPPFPFKLNQS